MVNVSAACFVGLGKQENWSEITRNRRGNRESATALSEECSSPGSQRFPVTHVTPVCASCGSWESKKNAAIASGPSLSSNGFSTSSYRYPSDRPPRPSAVLRPRFVRCCTAWKLVDEKAASGSPNPLWQRRCTSARRKSKDG